MSVTIQDLVRIFSYGLHYRIGEDSPIALIDQYTIKDIGDILREKHNIFSLCSNEYDGYKHECAQIMDIYTGRCDTIRLPGLMKNNIRGLITWRDKVLMFGGWDNYKLRMNPTRTVSVYDTSLKKFTRDFSDMMDPFSPGRSHYLMLDDKEDRILCMQHSASELIYYPAIKRWDKLEVKMPVTVAGSGTKSVAINGVVYSFGNISFTRSFEMWDTRSNTVYELPNSKWQTYYSATCSLDKNIYACGGDESDACQKYDIVAGKWQYIASLNTRRSYPDCVCLLDKIYCFEGTSYSKVCTNYNKSLSMEVYDPIKNTWEPSYTMSDPWTCNGSVKCERCKAVDRIATVI